MKKCALSIVLLVCLLAGCGAKPAEQLQTTAPTQPTQMPETSAPTQPPETTLATEPPPTEPEPEITQITLSFVGDCTFGRNQEAQYWNSFDHSYDTYGADHFLQNVRDIFTADDLTVINLEGPLTTSEDIQEKRWNHKGNPAYVQVMTGSSVEVATMGNNHRLDYGESGSAETVSVLENAGITYCYDDVFAICEVKGVKIGIAAVNLFGYWQAEKWLEDGQRQLREAGCDITVACVHWGDDKATAPNAQQLQKGRKIVDMGYDLVIGNHPHVLQGIEYYNGKLICYSLGNFCYGGSKNPVDKDSGIFQQTFTLADGILQPQLDARFIPCSVSSVTERNDYCPTPSQGEEFNRILEKLNGYCQTMGVTLDSEGRICTE